MKKFFFLLATLAQSGFSSEQSPEKANVFGLTQGVIASPSKGDWGGYFQAEVLYWSSYENGLEYAYQQNSSEDAAPSTDPNVMPTIEHGHFTRVGGDWAPGVRLEAGIHTPFDSWDLYARWTRVCNHSSDTAEVSDLTAQNLAPIWLGAGYAKGYESVLRSSSSWNLLYNVLDVACMRAYFSSSRLAISVHAGLQGAWINQQFYVRYSEGTVTQNPTYFKGKNDFQSAGLFSACGMSWYLSKEWKILSRFQGAINFGRYKLQQQVLAAVVDGSSSVPYSLHDVLSEVMHRSRFSYEVGLGVEWAGPWKNDNCTLKLRAMYDLSQWVHLNQLRRFTFVNSANDRYFYSSNGDLGFQGISVAVQVDY